MNDYPHTVYMQVYTRFHHVSLQGNKLGGTSPIRYDDRALNFALNTVMVFMIIHLWNREFRRVGCSLPAKVFQVATFGHTLCPMTGIDLSLVQVEEFSRTVLEVTLPGAFVTVTSG